MKETHPMSDRADPLHTPARDLSSAERSRSVLHEGNVLKGEWTTDGIIEFGGKFFGDLKADTLVLTRSGHIEGTVVARNVLIEGNFSGAISARSVTIKSAAILAANIACQDLTVESGATIEGHLACRPESR